MRTGRLKHSAIDSESESCGAWPAKFAKRDAGFGVIARGQAGRKWESLAGMAHRPYDFAPVVIRIRRLVPVA